MPDSPLLAIAAVIVALNVAATVVAWRATEQPRARRLAQTLLAWLLPVVGSVTVIALAILIAYEDRRLARPERRRRWDGAMFEDDFEPSGGGDGGGGGD